MPTFKGICIGRYCSFWQLLNGIIVAAAIWAMVVTGVATSEAQAPRPFRLARMAPLPLPQHPIARAEKDFPFFPHQPIADAGFNALFLPFHHAFANASHGFNRAQAFAFLFSLDLDWAPGNYCNRHAYFLYNRSGANMVRLLRHYSKSAIARYFPGWQASVAVGGTLKHGAGGYTATIVLYNRHGRLIHTMRYNTPLSFWNLLGAVDVGFMTYMKEPPSPALAHYLCEPRCNSMQCLTELGKAAFLPIESTRAFALFRKVLRLDPRFAEVRYWFENQAAWRGTDGMDKLESELAQSLKNRLLPFPASIFDPAACHNKQLAQVLAKLEPAILAESKKLTGLDSPLVLTEELNWKTYKPWQVSALLREATRVADKYPNDYDLLSDLAYLYNNRHLGVDDDADMAASIASVALRDRWMTGTLVKRSARRDLAAAAYETGHFGIAATLYLQSQTPHNLGCGFWSLAEMGQFRLILRLWPKILRRQPSAVHAVVPAYAFAAAMCGDRADLSQIIKTYPSVLQQQGVFDAMRYCSVRLSGGDTSHFVLGQPVEELPGFNIHLYIQAERDLEHHSERSEQELLKLFVVSPFDRITWEYFDAYTGQETHPQADDHSFYDALLWLHPGDPWAKRAMKNYLARVQNHPPAEIDPNYVLSLFGPLEKYKHNKIGQITFNRTVFFLPVRDLNPFDAVAAVHEFVQQSHFKKAARLAHFLEWYAYICQGPGLTQLARHVVYMVRKAEENAKK